MKWKMLNHETDVIGNSQNTKKKKKMSSVIVQNYFHLCGIVIICRLFFLEDKTAQELAGIRI